MALLIHIIIALTGIAFATYLFVSPSQIKFRISFGLVILTIASGSYLVIAAPSQMVHACMTGLAYITFVLIAMIAAQYKLARQSI